MELNALLFYAAVPVALLATSAGLAHAYNRLRSGYTRIENDRQSYLEVLEASNDALFVVNFVNGRIYQANDMAAAMLGYTREQLARLTIFELHPASYLHLSAERIADAWESKGLIYEDIPLLHADGRVIPVESSTKVTSYRGYPAIILFARDITERLELKAKVSAQQAIVHQQNQDLLSSIRYAKRIQQAVLPSGDALQDLILGSFVLHRPKDIVSGDMHWFGERDGRLVLIAADCTGHGVPGALLTLIGASIFQELVHERGLTRPSELLDNARTVLASTLGTDEEESGPQDGMNAAVVSLDREARKLTYAGAFAPLVLVRQGELLEFKGDRMPVGHTSNEVKGFEQVEVELLPGDRIYLFSDGLQDQFGGPNGKRLRSSGLKQWLLETAMLPIDDQYQAISDRFRMWKGREEQVDDVLLIGVEIS